MEHKELEEEVIGKTKVYSQPGTRTRKQEIDTEVQAFCGQLRV